MQFVIDDMIIDFEIMSVTQFVKREKDVYNGNQCGKCNQ